MMSVGRRDALTLTLSLVREKASELLIPNSSVEHVLFLAKGEVTGIGCGLRLAAAG